MKRFLIVGYLLMISSCGPGLQIIEYSERHYSVGIRKETPVGGVMMAYEHGAYRASYGPDVKSAIEWRLEYAGFVQGVLKIAYRETQLSPEYDSYGGTYVTERLARPAFNQDLTYDLSSTKVIVFRQVKIQIHSADQERVVFTVIEAP